MKFSLRRCVLTAIFLCFLLGVLLGIYITKHEDAPEKVRDFVGRSVEGGILLQKLKPRDKRMNQQPHESLWKQDPGRSNKIFSTRGQPAFPKKAPQVLMVLDPRTLDRLKTKYPVEERGHPSYDVHAFYYSWYGNPDLDDQYLHWNHRFLPHWNKLEKAKWSSGRHVPPDDIGSNYYPALGPYSSKNPDVIAQHMVHFRTAGVGVLSLSWYPPDTSDDEGKPPDPGVPALLDIANLYGIKVNFHIEPYRGRNPSNLRENVRYILERYGHHPAFYRRQHKGKSLAMFYIYDSYLIDAKDWATLLTPHGRATLRGTDVDALFIGLLVDKEHKADLVAGGFDGFYTYFASNKFTFGSTWDNWAHLATFARARDLLFVPSVGPGYIDTEVRPWNGVNTKSRERGTYYESSFKAAVDTSPSLITITSFNEWHEGTQIEPAVIKRRGQSDYLNYSPGRPEYYLDLTRKLVKAFQQDKFRSALRHVRD